MVTRDQDHALDDRVGNQRRPAEMIRPGVGVGLVGFGRGQHFVLLRAAFIARPRVTATLQGRGLRGAYPAIMASRAMRSRIFSRSLSLFSCPQAARMSRPRGVRIGEA